MEINPSIGHGFKIMPVSEWSHRWKKNDDFPDCLGCKGTNTKEHHFTQVEILRHFLCLSQFPLDALWMTVHLKARGAAAECHTDPHMAPCRDFAPSRCSSCLASFWHDCVSAEGGQLPMIQPCVLCAYVNPRVVAASVSCSCASQQASCP